MPLYLGIDVGTTSVKAGVFDHLGRTLALARRDYTLDTPSVDQVELDAELYWQASLEVVRRCLTEPEVSSDSVSAIAVSSQGETTIAVDAQGLPLHPALVWLDNRARQQAIELGERLGAEVYPRTGIPGVNPTWSACKILWLAQEEPRVFEAAHKFILVQDFIVHRLAGVFATDGAVACTTLLYDIVRHAWWDRALEAVGLTPSRLSEIHRPGTIAGELTASAAEALGLRSGIPVVLGGMDQSAGAVGAGSITPEIISETTGGALAVQATVSAPDVDRSQRVPVYVHSAPDRYLFVPVCDTGGMAFKWLRDTFGQLEMDQAARSGGDAYDLLTSEAEDVPAGSDGLLMLPHLTGAFSPEYNPAARGVFYGFTLFHRRGHFVRATLEAVAFMLRRNLELIQQAGVKGQELRSTGGGARSRLWRQIKADVCGLPVLTLGNPEAALMGDAILAAAATGAFATLDEACREMVAIGESLNPDPQSQAAYQTSYRDYCELYDALAPLFRRQFGPA
jgi:sugar (pentulose or hexulose) kinase